MYNLPQLKYGFKDLEPYISEEQLKIHYEKHHQAYVNSANALFQKIETARKENSELDIKSLLKDLSFQIGGHILHSIFWENLKKDGKKNPEGKLAEAINKEFGSFERFKAEFTKTAQTVEGSGWAVLAICEEKLLIMQIEKHNMGIIPNAKIIMALDVFEHAYYIDYKNDRAKFIENFWNIIDWDEVEKKFA